MAEELGKIEKLDIEQFGLRKLYVVPLIFSAPDAPPDYKEKLEKYWREVNEQIANQEVKVGKIQRIYHESMSAGGAEGLKIIAEINPLSHLIAKDKFESGAVFEATELAELADECIDWERCLLMGLYSRKALEMVAEAYEKCSVKRFEYIGRRIDETCRKGKPRYSLSAKGKWCILLKILKYSMWRRQPWTIFTAGCATVPNKLKRRTKRKRTKS